MHPKLSVTVQVDLSGQHLTLAVTGTLTTANQQALPPLVERARTAFPAAALTVDLHQVRLADATAIDLLAHRLQHGHPGTGPCDTGPTGNATVQITAPARPHEDTAPRRHQESPAVRGARRRAPHGARPATGVTVPRRRPDPAPAGGSR